MVLLSGMAMLQGAAQKAAFNQIEQLLYPAEGVFAG
jgi:hypothetical protein